MTNSNHSLWKLTASELSKGIRTKAYSCREVVQSCLDRVEEVNSEFNAVVSLQAADALAAADAADKAVAQGDDLGSLHGIPVTTKVNVDQKGLPTTNGVVAFKDLVAPSDNPVISNLRKAGAIIIGRTNTPAFSMRWFTDNDLHGRTLNPWRKDRTPGGSSGGAAVSVATAMCPIAHGNDGGGSIRYANATVKFEPGSKQGGSVAVIDNPQGKSWRVKGGVDNSGSEATGEIQQVGNAETYNWLGLNDVITVNYGRDSLPSTSISASDSKSISASVPYGYWLLSLSASRFTYQNPIRGTTQTFKSSGATTSYRGDLERVLHRDQVSKTTLTGSLTHKKIKNYVEDLLLDVSSRKLTVAGLLATHSRRLGQGLIAISAGYEVGLRSLGAKDDYDRGLDSPEAQFEKYTADLTIIQNFQLAGLNFVATSGARGQWTPDIRDTDDFFEDIDSVSVDRDMLGIAMQLVERKTSEFDPSKFEDRYELRLRQLIDAKTKGIELEEEPEVEAPNVVNLMDALKRSLKGEKTERKSGSDDDGEERKSATVHKLKPKAKAKAASSKKPAAKKSTSKKRKAG